MNILYAYTVSTKSDYISITRDPDLSPHVTLTFDLGGSTESSFALQEYKIVYFLLDFERVLRVFCRISTTTRLAR